MAKKLFHPGTGLYQPNEHSAVVVDIVGRYRTPTGGERVFYQKEGTSMKIGEASDVLSETLEECICSMKTGERCELLVDSKTIRASTIPELPKECTVVYSIRLVSFERGKNVWKLTDQERLEIAQHHKTLGTEIFQTGNITAAAIHYSKAMKYLIPIELDTTEQVGKDASNLRAIILLNLAACQLKFQQHHLSAKNCTKVLQLEPENVKALYRRGQALANMSDFEQARLDLMKAKQLEPGNRAIEEQLRVLNSKEQAQKAKYKDAMKSMFGEKP